MTTSSSCLSFCVATFPYTPWFLAAWNAMAVDQHVEKPEVEKFADESAAKESGSQGRAEGND